MNLLSLIGKNIHQKVCKRWKNEQKINHLPQKVGAKDERVDLAHFLHPESSSCNILPISCSSKVWEIRQNDFQKRSKVFQYVQKCSNGFHMCSKVFQSLPHVFKRFIIAQTSWTEEKGQLITRMGSGGHQTGRDKFSSDGDTWDGRHVKARGGGVKREDLSW